MKIQAAVSRSKLTAPRIETVDLDEPRANEARVRIIATGICHTDILCHEGLGVPVPYPIVLGHEGAGVVEAVGAGVHNLSPGDHVVLSGASCGVCPSCRSARPTYCRDAMKLSFSGMRADGSSPLSQDGARISGAFFGQSSFATHANVPESSAVKVASDLPLHLLGPLGCGIINIGFAMMPPSIYKVFAFIGYSGDGAAGVEQLTNSANCVPRKRAAPPRFWAQPMSCSPMTPPRLRCVRSSPMASPTASIPLPHRRCLPWRRPVSPMREPPAL